MKKNKGKKEKEHTLEPKSRNAKEPGPKRKEVKKLERSWRTKKGTKECKTRTHLYVEPKCQNVVIPSVL